MKKFGILLGIAVFAASVCGPRVQAEAAELPCKGAYVCDFDTGTEVYAFQEEEHLPIASMCKIMTLLLAFESIDRGELSYEEDIEISDRAQSMGGSQVYLQAGLCYGADDLMRAVAVCSANDACVALSERICGTEEAFVRRMNERACELGAENTLFSNCTGLPKEPQYSCARDVALMLRALLSHEKYFGYCSVRTENFEHPDGRTTLITNTNKLIRSYTGCDGGKTGFTNEAGFCLAATAKRGETRLISVVIGSPSSEERFSASAALLDEGFASYETTSLFGEGVVPGITAHVGGSATREIPVELHTPIKDFKKRGEESDAAVRFDIKEGLRAPIEKGTMIGEAVLHRAGVEVGRVPLYAGESAERFSWWDAYREAARNWN